MIPTGDAVPTPGAELVAAIRRGSTEALRDLYQQFGTAMYQAAFRVTGSRADAEDVIQDVFLGLPRAVGSYREEGKLAGWLTTLAVRTALMRLRRSRREEPLSELAVELRAGPEPSAARRAEAIDLLERLAEPLRQVFLLKEVEGYRHQEIAALLGISVAASEVRLHRAWRQLQRLSEET